MQLFTNSTIGRRAAALAAGGMIGAGSFLGFSPTAGAGDTTPTCTLDQIRVERSADAGWGRLNHKLSFTNTGTGSCTIRGFPGVDLKGTDTTTASVPRTGEAYDTVQVDVGQTVSATVSTKLGDFPENCNPVEIDTMWVTLPGDTRATPLAADGKFCRRPGVTTTWVTPVKA